MASKKSGGPKRAAGTEEQAQQYVDAVRKELRQRLLASEHLFTELSKELGHSPTYLSSVLAAQPRTELRLSTVVRLLTALDHDPAAFFSQVFGRVRREMGEVRREPVGLPTAMIEAWASLASISSGSSGKDQARSAALIRAVADLVEQASGVAGQSDAAEGLGRPPVSPHN